MRTAKQLGFEILESKETRFFGGSHLGNSNPKSKRPITTKQSMHLVMRSTLAKGNLSLLRYEKRIQDLISRQGKVHGVKIYRQANGGNHLHLVVRPHSRKAFIRFIRSVSGLVARIVLNAQKNKPSDKLAQSVQSFWDKRPFTRVIKWGRDFQGVCAYLFQNTLEAWGFIPFQPRRNTEHGQLSTA